MITSSNDRNFLIFLSNVFLFLSVVLTAIFNIKFALYLPSINLHADINLLLLVAVLFADKFENQGVLLLHTLIYGVIFDLYYTHSIGIFTLYVSITALIANIVMIRTSNSLFFRIFIIVIALIFKDLYLYVIYQVIEINYISFPAMIYRMVFSVVYNTIIYIVLFNILSLFKRYREITYSNV